MTDRLESFMLNNYYRKLSVREICACVDYNPDYAGRLFRLETGQSIIEYLNRVRVRQAKILLLDSDLTLSDIAEMTGFSSETYFFAVVRRLEGTTPAKIRARMRAIQCHPGVEGGAETEESER